MPRMNRRGINPLITTVLLVGFTIVLAALLMQFGTEWVKSLTEQPNLSGEPIPFLINVDANSNITNITIHSSQSEGVSYTINWTNGTVDLNLTLYEQPKPTKEEQECAGYYHKKEGLCEILDIYETRQDHYFINKSLFYSQGHDAFIFVEIYRGKELVNKKQDINLTNFKWFYYLNESGIWENNSESMDCGGYFHKDRKWCEIVNISEDNKTYTLTVYDGSKLIYERIYNNGGYVQFDFDDGDYDFKHFKTHYYLTTYMFSNTRFEERDENANDNGWICLVPIMAIMLFALISSRTFKDILEGIWDGILWLGRLLTRKKKTCQLCNKKVYSLYTVYFSNKAKREICSACTKNTVRCTECSREFYKVNMYGFKDRKICEYCHRKVKQCQTCNKDFISHNKKKVCASCGNYKEILKKSSKMRCLPLFKRELTKKDNLEVFGVELETICKHNINLNHPYLKHFEKTDDASLSSGGREFRSHRLRLNDKGITTLKNFTKLAKGTMGVDTSCGFHLHLFIHKEYQTLKNFKNIIKGYQLMERFFYTLVSPSRKGNSYCKSINNYVHNGLLNCKTLKSFLETFFGTTIKDEESPRIFHHRHYYWVELNSIFYRSTIEIRLHQGTYDAYKIINWYKIHRDFLKWLMSVNYEEVCKLNEKMFLTEVIKDPEIIAYINERQKKFEEEN